MKRGKKTQLFKILAAAIAVMMTIQCFYCPAGIQKVYAAGEESAAAGLITGYQPRIIAVTSEMSGFVHPGVGLTEGLLDNVQYQIRSGTQPWITYFEDMLASSAASKTPSISLTDPGNTPYNSQGTNGKFIRDALTAYTQAILYYVTGDNIYRKNALNILRIWSRMNPDTYEYFNDACIHVGIPMNRMCIAAEIIRYSTYEVSDGYAEKDLKWTDQEITDFINNLVSPAVNTFMSGNNEFMNQHLYTVIGSMSGYLFMDDAKGYAKTVEWFTVNRDGANPGFNGSIKRLFREITTIDEVGTVEGSGTPLEKPVIQHVEMGRDQAHGCGDLTNAAILARLMLGQGTRIDPQAGTISSDSDAVGIYEFLDDRILKAADFFFQYMLGYDAEWVQVPFSIRDGIIVDNYTDFSPNYRGRYKTINFWDLYAYYTYCRKDVDLEKEYPYFYEGFMKKTPSNYYWNGGMEINWDNVDGGGDFWLFLPSEAAWDDKLLAEEQTDYMVETEDRGAMVENRTAMSIGQEGSTEYVRFMQSSARSRLAVTSGGVGGQTIAFRIRTDGTAKLSLSGIDTDVYLPDTGGQWRYVTLTRSNTEGFGDLYDIIITDIAGSYVDIDAVDIKPNEEKKDRNRIDILAFENGEENLSLITYAGAPLSLSFAAVNSDAGQAISYKGIGLPQGAAVNTSTGVLEWTPDMEGTYIFYVNAEAGKTSLLKKVRIEVKGGRNAAIAGIIASYGENTVYKSKSLKNYQEALETTQAMAEGASDEEFAVQLNILNEAVSGLEPVSPLLKDDPLTDGTSLDYTKMVYYSTMGNEIYNLIDGQGTFCGYYTAVNNEHIMDFGPDFKISVTKFGYKARLGFSDRLAGTQVFGSNDKKNWTRLTTGEASFTQAYQEVGVKKEEQDNQYRYLKIYKTTNYPEALRGNIGTLLEFGELRIYGTCYEVGNKIESISMSSDQSVSGRIKMGDTVTLEIHTTEPVKDITAVIQGVPSVTEGSGTLWRASAVMNPSCATGDIEITLDYTKQDGTAGDTFYDTTDATSLFLTNSLILIPVKTLAADITASSGSWDGKLTPAQCGELIFDGDINTFGDLKNAKGDYYTVDFGEGVEVNLKEILLMPRSTAQNHADRLNGTIVSGSRDGKDWVQITPAVRGAVMKQWTQIKEEELLDNGAYRYFMISGAAQGDIAEVEFYGMYTADPALIAGRITKIDPQLPSQEVMAYPSVPYGYTVSIRKSENEDVIGADGKINIPLEDTVVKLILSVIHDATGRSADTGTIEVLVKGMGSLVAGIDMPEKGAGKLTLPDVPEGFRVSVETSSNENIIALGDGRITTPAYNTLVDVRLKLVRKSDSAEVISEPYTILVYGENPSEKIDVLTWGQAAASTGRACDALFDGNTETWEEAGKDSYYTIDFGEKLPVILDKIRLYPRSTKADHAARMNGAYLSGSKDGENWVTITDKVEGAVMHEWIEFCAEQFHAYDAYRYIRIAGATLGCIGEVELYGIMSTSAEELASSIKAVADIEATQSSITMPAVPAGYTISIATTSAPGIIAEDGTVSTPQNDTQVILTFMVAGFGGSAVTSDIAVNVKGISGAVSALRIPEPDAEVLTLPDAPEGFTLSIESSSNTGVIDVDARITTPEEDTLVDITLKLTRISDGSVVMIPAQTILVYGAARNIPVSIAGKATVAASADPYDAAYTRETVGALLVDGDTKTFGDLKGNGTYTVDFGENHSVILDMVRLYPRTKYAYRLDGTYIRGSADGKTWITITAPVQEAVDGKWYEIKAEEFLAYGGFRYFEIAGCSAGNVAEVEFYGVYKGDGGNGTVTGGDAGKPDGTVTGGDAGDPDETVTGGDAGDPDGTVTGGDAADPDGTVNGGDSGEDSSGDKTVSDTEAAVTGQDDAADPLIDWHYVDHLLVRRSTDHNRQDYSVWKNVDITAGREIAVPASILERLRSSSLTLALHIKDMVTLSISGENIPHNIRVQDMKLSVLPKCTDQAAVSRLRKGTNDITELAFLNGNSFGMRVNMHFNFGADRYGSYASLYKYSVWRKEFVYMGSYRITKQGQAMFGFTMGAEYVVTVTSELPR